MGWCAKARKRLCAVAAAATLLALSGCSASQPAAAPQSSTAGGMTAGSASGTARAGAPGSTGNPGNNGDSGNNANPGTNGNNNSGVLAWVPPGPVDPADPPQSQWYVLLQAKDCDGLAAAVNAGNATTSDGFALWTAATAACRAVYQGQASGWTDAAAGLATVQRPGDDRCLDRAAYDLVAALVTFHAEHPAAAPSPAAGPGTACPLGLVGLDALDGRGPTSTPSSGLAGGRFQLAGRFLDVVAVVVGGQRVTAEPDPDQPGRWDAVIPSAAAAGTVQITAEGSAGAIPGSLTFTYLSASTTAPEATTDGQSTVATPSEGDPG